MQNVAIPGDRIPNMIAPFQPGRHLTFDTGLRSCHLEIETAHPNVLSGGDAGRIERIAGFLDFPKKTLSRRKHITVHGHYKDIPITAFSTGIGTASVSVTLPEIIEACSSPDMVILRLGTSGGLQSYLNIGDLVVTYNVERHETTSDKIMGPGYIARADPDVAQALLEQAHTKKTFFQKVYCGTTKVTDDLYFFNRWLKAQKDYTAVALSMEFSAYCALRDAYNKEFGYHIRTGEVLTISDIVVPHKIKDRQEFDRRQVDIEGTLLLTGLETLVALKNR